MGLATSENMSVHADMAAKKSAVFPPEITACLARMKAAHGHFAGAGSGGPAHRDAGEVM